MASREPRILIIGGGPTGCGAAIRLMERRRTNWQILEAEETVGGLARSFKDNLRFTWDIGGHVVFSHYQYFDDVLKRCGPTMSPLKRQAVALYPLTGPAEEKSAGASPSASQASSAGPASPSTVRTTSTAATPNAKQCEGESEVETVRVVGYPVQNHVHQLPSHIQWECVEGLLDAYTAQIRDSSEVKVTYTPRTFADWARGTMGEGLLRHFLRPYNEKLWAHSLEVMSSTWLGERVAVPDLRRILRNLVENRDEVPWGPNVAFTYPSQGGIGTLWKSIGLKIPVDKVKYNSKVVRIDPSTKTVFLQGGATLKYDICISTIPLTTLTQSILIPSSAKDASPARPTSEESSPIPRERLQLSSLGRLTEGLLYTSTIAVGFGLHGKEPEICSKFHWAYFPEPECPFYRCSVLSHYSPCMCHERRPGYFPHPYYSLLFECSYSNSRPGLGVTNIDELKSEIEKFAIKYKLIDRSSSIVSRWHHVARHGYPLPSIKRDEILNVVLPTLESEADIYSRGRFGAWKYEVGNMDHSLMQGVEVVDRILGHDDQGPHSAYFATEPTLNTPSQVNGRKDETRLRQWF